MYNSRVFVCYSVPLMKFLTSNNVRYDVVGLNSDNKNTFWGFVKDDKLNKLLEQWSKNNPNK